MYPTLQERPALRIGVLMFFLALIAVPVAMRRHYAPPQPPPTTAQRSGMASMPYGFSLQECAHACGIDFVHQAPVLDARLDHIMPEVAAMGAAVSIVDYDRDGWPDIYVTNSGIGSKNSLYHNNHDGTFTDVAEKLGVADLNQPGTGVCMGAVWGDYDNDGYEDLCIYKWGRCELFHNEKGTGFRRITEHTGLPAWANINSAIWVDYDNDGHLDLLLCGYYPEDVDLFHLKNTRMMPDSFEYATNGGRKYLLKGHGDGTFEDVTASMGIDSHRWTLAAVAADLRGTGYPDLVLANDYGYTEYYANQKGKGFKEVGKSVGIAVTPKSGMNASVGDIYNNGSFSIYISNISEEGQLLQGNNLWVPVQGTSGDSIRYDNMANTDGVEVGGWSFGAQFVDLNNDGNQDIFLTNGYISLDRTKESYWYDFGKVSGGNASIISDAANWPPLKGRSHSGYQQKKVWLNDGLGSFTEVSQMVGVTDLHDGRAVAVADLWNTGAMDVVVANQRGPVLVYKNTVSDKNKWIEFELEGVASNRSAIGAQVTLYWNRNVKQVQEISGGSGFCAQNQRSLHFGLGADPRIEKAEIRWPSGKVQVIQSPEPQRMHHIKEAS